MNDIPGRTLYVSLTGTERTEWKKGLAAIAAGLFVSGALIGAGIVGLSRRGPARPPEPHRLRQQGREGRAM